VSYLKYVEATKYEALPDVLSRSMSARANQCTALVTAIKVHHFSFIIYLFPANFLFFLVLSFLPLSFT
jgi:hypothetical protein